MRSNSSVRQVVAVVARFVLIVFFVVTCFDAKADGQQASSTPPNVIMIVADDMGYGDLSCYGSERCSTPNIDWIASQGVRFTNCLSAAPVDSAARASILTGCYPQRLSITSILHPRTSFGLNPERQTIADLLKSKNYRTAFIGNWHLGCLPDLRPSNHGFDETFFIAFSPEFALVSQPAQKDNPKARAVLPLFHNDKMVDGNPDRNKLLSRFTDHAIDWIKRDQEQPFFLMYQLHLPHVPLDIEFRHRGLTRKGRYADTIKQIDHMVGRFESLTRNTPELKNTIFIFTSDNGPRLEYGDHGGDSGPFRNGKYSCFEGGFRVPCIVSWPGKIKTFQQCDQMITNMDWLPTIATWTGAEMDDAPFDGLDLTELIADPRNKKTPHEFFFYYRGWDLHAVRSGNWKMHLEHEFEKLVEPGSKGVIGKTEKAKQPKSLFNLQADPAELIDLGPANPETLMRFEALAEFARREFGDLKSGVSGRAVRPHKKSKFATATKEP